MEGSFAKMCEIHAKPRKGNLPMIMPLFCHYFATMRLPGQMRQLLAWSIQAPRVAKLQQITSKPLS